MKIESSRIKMKDFAEYENKKGQLCFELDIKVGKKFLEGKIKLEKSDLGGLFD